MELLDFDRLAVHHNVQKTVDLILRGVPSKPEIRVRTGSGAVEVVQKEESQDFEDPGFNQRFPSLSRAAGENGESNGNGHNGNGHSRDESQKGLMRIYAYGIQRTRLERAIREKRAPAYVVTELSQADAIMAIRTTYQSRPKKLRELAGKTIPTVVVKSNTFAQIACALDEILNRSTEGKDFESEAMEEVLSAIETVIQSGKPYELAPQPATIRKMQHQVTEARRVASESVGEEPNRRLRVLPNKLS